MQPARVLPISGRIDEVVGLAVAHVRFALLVLVVLLVTGPEDHLAVVDTEECDFDL